MKQRILSLVLALVLLLALLPAAAMAAGTVQAATLTVPAPQPGCCAFLDYGDIAIAEDDSFVTLYFWQDADTGDILGHDDTFVGGRQYRLLLDLRPVDKAVPFDTEKPVTVTVNGAAADSCELTAGGTQASVAYTFPRLPKQIIDAINVTVKEPKEGELASYLVELGEPGYHLADMSDDYYVNGVGWRDPYVGNSWTDLMGGKPFSAGGSYEVTVVVEPDDGYQFLMNGSTFAGTATINGQPTKYAGEYNYKTDLIYFYYQFPELAPSPEDVPIDKISLTVAAPAAGETIGIPVLTAAESTYDIVDSAWFYQGKAVLSGCFAAEEIYTLKVRLKAHGGCSFFKDSLLFASAAINGAAADIQPVIDDPQADVELTLDFLAPGPTVVLTSVDAEVSEPFPGSQLVRNALGDEQFGPDLNWKGPGAIKGVSWAILNSADPNDVKELCNADAVCEGGTWYRLSVALSANYGYEFAKNITDDLSKLTVYGERVDAAYFDGDSLVLVKVYAPINTLASIAVKTPPTRTDYAPGETFDRAGLLMTAYFTDGSSMDVWGDFVDVTPSGPLSETDTFVTLALSSANVTKTVKLPITVDAGNALASIAVTAPPAQTAYLVGQVFEPYGMEVTATYVNQKTAVVEGWTVTPAGKLTEADTSVTVSYTLGGVTKTATVPITVKSPEETKPVTAAAVTVPVPVPGAAPVFSAAVAGEGCRVFTEQAEFPGMIGGVAWTEAAGPTKDDYDVGTGLGPKDSFQAGKYYFATVALTAEEGHYFDLDPKDPYAVTVNGKTAFDWTVVSGSVYAVAVFGPLKGGQAPVKTLTGVAVTAPPLTTAYHAGESFQSLGMVVTAAYSDGSTAEVTGYTVAPAVLVEGVSAVTVSYTEGGVTVTAGVPVTVAPKEKEPDKDKKANPFTDVAETDYFYDAVIWACYAQPQVTNGIGNSLFAPDSTVKRCEAVTFLWRAVGCPEPTSKTNPFVDVTETDYFYKPVLWAVEKGITKGTDETHFTPEQTCSTAHILTFLYRSLGVGPDGWYTVAEAWAKGAGLLAGLDVAVAPGVDCPRRDVVLFLFRAVGA